MVSQSFANPAYYINRELSWLEFNARVLEEAADPTQPLLERLRFLCIFGTNLDEFFEIRVAGIKQQIENGNEDESLDGLTPSQVFERIHEKVRKLVDEAHRIWLEEIEPQLKKEGICISRVDELSKEEKLWAGRYFEEEVFPVLTPLAIDPSHPFPQLLNKSTNLIVSLRRPSIPHRASYAIVQMPRMLPRLVAILRSESEPYRFIFLQDLIAHFLGSLFPGDEVTRVDGFRITRNSDLYIDDEEAENLLRTVEEELRKRNRGNAVRLEIQADCPVSIENILLEALRLAPVDVYRLKGPLNFLHLEPLVHHEAFSHLRDRPWNPVVPKAVASATDLFELLRKKDLLLHHPYESFRVIVDFLWKAAEDPLVLGIKMTLYRTSGDSPLVQALIRAAELGKQVTALVEIKARFDEANNIQWARRMEEAGIHVVYGLLGLKTHCKMLQIIRKDPDRIRLYVHLGTGNYHPSTARIYEDISLLTTREDLTSEVARLFNTLTGLTRFHGIEKLLVAPFNMATRFRELIAQEAEWARQGKPARIIAKMNSLCDETLIVQLYEASCAGVKIDLIVRGICCLRPGIPHVSENIRVVSIVGRFLEHSRIFYFLHGGNPLVYAGSADWMPRNLYRRVEVVFPIEEPELKTRIEEEILASYLKDCGKARELRPDGSYQRLHPPPGEKPFQAQLYFRQLAREEQALIQKQENPDLSMVPLRKSPLAQPLLSQVSEISSSPSPLETPPQSF
ncbi:Polyphosphate kinase [Candidatus Methylacidithermus pantelleriae]|uniref:Polyphosphate kinase n=2 Tax=Candidatus Methylacidithermus pantelleriae TaxID=2744239 RepID=A0A8J2BL47_9BACT|nr:Polyphosphate kinase [Candidatus Methylacidithermus pantelleriae]